MAHYLVIGNDKQRAVHHAEARSDREAAEQFAQAFMTDDDAEPVTVYVYLLRDPQARPFRLGRRTEVVYDVEARDG